MTCPLHVLVPRPMLLRLRLMSDATMISQAEYLREAVADVLAKYTAPGEQLAPLPQPMKPLGQLVFRVSSARRQQLDALATGTRVAESCYLRQAVYDVLAKHGWHERDVSQAEDVPACPAPPMAVVQPQAVAAPMVNAAPLVRAPRCGRRDCGLQLDEHEVRQALLDGDWRCVDCRARRDRPRRMVLGTVEVLAP